MAPLGKPTEKHFPSRGLSSTSASYQILCSLALVYMQRSAAGADPEDLRKATEWDNIGSGDFPRVFFVL